MTAGTAGAVRAAPSKPKSTRDRLTDYLAVHRSTTILLTMTLVTIGLPLLSIVPPFSFFQKQDVWLSGFSNAGVFVLLALGLNIVVGLAGLLDLGYAAFFAIGAYVYAYGASPYSGLHLPFLVMLAIAPLVAATFGVLLGRPDPAAARRLPRDRHPRLRRDRPDRVPQRREVHRGHQRHRRHLQAGPAVRRVLAPEPVAVLRADGGDGHDHR